MIIPERTNTTVHIERICRIESCKQFFCGARYQVACQNKNLKIKLYVTQFKILINFHILDRIIDCIESLRKMFQNSRRCSSDFFEKICLNTVVSIYSNYQLFNQVI